MSMEESQKNDRINMLSKVERLELGNKIMQITKALELNIEAIDKGSNEMSEKNWNSSISIRSGSSTIIRRQYNMNGTITSFDGNQPDDSIDEGNIDSKDSLDEPSYAGLTWLFKLELLALMLVLLKSSKKSISSLIAIFNKSRSFSISLKSIDTASCILALDP